MAATVKKKDKKKESKEKPKTEFINKINSETLDRFIEEVLETGKIDEVQTLDLSRKKLNELNPKIRFYFRMLKNLVNLNLYCNKLRFLPPEIGLFLRPFLHTLNC
jgi:hypothetical protein